LIIHLATSVDFLLIERQHNQHHTRERRLRNGEYIIRNSYQALDRTRALAGELINRIVNQAMDCYLDEVSTFLHSSGRVRPKGSRRRHIRSPSFLFFECSQLVQRFAPFLDKMLSVRLRVDFGIDGKTATVLGGGPQRMAFQDTSYYDSLVKHVLSNREDCDPFALHYLNYDGANERMALALEHRVTEPRLINGYKAGFRALAGAFSKSRSARKSPLSVIRTDPGFEWPDGRRIHAIVCNLEKCPHDAGCIHENNTMPYIVLPHRWQCSNMLETFTRGFTLATHEGTHVYNEAVLSGLRHVADKELLKGWEWFDEATAIFMEAALFEQHFPRLPQLWLEHVEDWVLHPFCPVVDCSPSQPFCGRGAHAVMFLRFLAKRVNLGLELINRIWNSAANALASKRTSAPAINLLVEEIALSECGVSFSDLFEEYALQSYSIASCEPLISKKYGQWRRAESFTTISDHSAVQFTALEPRPLACAYHTFRLGSGLKRLRLTPCSTRPIPNLRGRLAWVSPNCLPIPSLLNADYEPTSVQEVEATSADGHFVLVLTQSSEPGLPRAQENLTFALEAL
jgi:hypothetical protein